MVLEFTANVWFWKGPAPWYFVSLPPKQARELRAIANQVTYGWGMIPVRVRIGVSEYSTSLWPKDDGYVVPLKAAVRRAEGIEEGNKIKVWLEVTRA